MNLPSFEAMMPAVLASLVDGKARPLREVFELVCQHYAFNHEQLADPLPSGRQTTIRSRVGWVKTYLVKAGIITQPKRDLCVLTQRDLNVLTLASSESTDHQYSPPVQIRFEQTESSPPQKQIEQVVAL